MKETSTQNQNQKYRDYTNPENGPKMMELYGLMNGSYWLNQTEVYAWYPAFTQYCQESRLCPTVDGFPAAGAFQGGPASSFSLFLLQPENQVYFADIKFEGLLPSGDIKAHKFRANSKHGIFYSYEGQRDGCKELHELALASEMNVVPFASAFPYFQIWQPAEDMLIRQYLPTSIAVVLILSFLILSPMVATILFSHFCLVILTVFGLGFAPFGHGFNLVSAPLILFLPPIIFDFVVHMAYRYSCMPGFISLYRNHKHPTLTPSLFPLTSGPRSTRKVERLLASFYPFSMTMSAIVLMFGMLLFLLCLSNINLFFFEIYEFILGCSVVYTLLFFIGMLTLPVLWQILILVLFVGTMIAASFIERA